MERHVPPSRSCGFDLRQKFHSQLVSSASQLSPQGASPEPNATYFKYNRSVVRVADEKRLVDLPS